jgi:DNA-binding transcriptional regulator GbsR (MarR family)
MAELTGLAEAFVLHWGEMGTRWGVNRTVAQIHALLFLSPEPLDAEQIATTLGVAKSNVSNSLRELQGWGIVKVVHVMGSRRDHYESLKDVWQMFQIILDERKKRETDPTLEVLRRLAGGDRSRKGKSEAYEHERVADMLEFFETMTRWYEQIRSLPTGAVVKFAKMGNKIRKLLGAAS